MPEGPEVRKIADSLEQAVGLQLIDITVVPNPKYKFHRNGIEGIGLLKFPCVIEKIVVKGKLIRIDLDNNLSIINTLGMSGTWRWTNPKHARAALKFNSNEVTFCDQRSFGNLKIVSRPDAVKAVQAIGWDLLQGPMSPKEWRKLQEKLKSKIIGPALMNQKQFSGIGNIYKAEILYELGINPTIKIENLDVKLWEKINITAHRILKDSYARGGSSVRSYSAGGRKGTYQNVLKIYNKKTCPLGHSTAKLKQKSRTTWYCPMCQKLPEVTLLPQEVKTCDHWAQKRSEERKKAGKEAKLKFHEIGCYGEYAVVKHFKCEWTGRYYEGETWKDRSWDTEVGEVRATFRPDINNGMVLYPSDSYPNAPYIWVNLRNYGSAVKAKLVGWINLKDGQKSEWWNSEQKIWVVPSDQLRPIEELK